MEIHADDPGLLGFVLRRELLERGYTDRRIARELARGSLARVRHGAYADGVAWRSLRPEQRYLVRARAAYAQARADVVLSHTSALALLGGPLWGLDLGDVHLTRTDARPGRREAGVQQHAGVLRAADVMETHGIRHTSPVRAGLEVCTVATLESSVVAMSQLMHQAGFTPEEARKRYDDEMHRWPHSLHTDLVLRLATPLMESVLEARGYLMMWQQGLPKPQLQYSVRDGSGTEVARLDAALPEYGVWLEFDGLEKYVKYLRPGESTADAVLREKKREDLVRELTGWRCLRITWADLADPVRLAHRIRRFLAAAQGD